MTDYYVQGFIIIRTSYTDSIDQEHKIALNVKVPETDKCEFYFQRAFSNIQEALAEQGYIRIADKDFSRDSVLSISYNIGTTSKIQFFESEGLIYQGYSEVQGQPKSSVTLDFSDVISTRGE